MNFEDSKNEEWRVVVIEGITTKYEVSSHGRLRRGQLQLKSSSLKNEYISCCIRVNGRSHTTRIHRIVGSAFIENPNGYTEINHIDGIKSNNKIENLEWCSRVRNIRHSFEIGLCVRPRGEKSHLYNKGRKIIDMVTGISYPSVATAALALGVPRTTIGAEVNGFRPSKYNLVKA